MKFVCHAVASLALIAPLALTLASCQSAPAAKPAPPPTIEVEMKTVEKMHPGCGDHGNRAGACVSFRAVWPELRGGVPAAVTKINATILNAIGFPGGAPEMESYGPKLIQSWRVEHRGLVYDDSTWFERRFVEILARRPGVWTLQSVYTAEIHNKPPEERRHYLNVDPQTGDAVALDKLLAADAAPKLAALAERKLRESRALAADAALPLKDGRFAMPREYAVTRGGLVLHWDADELTDKTVAELELTLRWPDVRSLFAPAALDLPNDVVRSPF